MTAPAQLRSGFTIWQSESLVPIHAAQMPGDARCEAVVVGAGITGALVAHRLIKSGVDVLLLDQREMGRGSTLASTGLLQYEIDTPLVDLIRKVGEQHAVHAYRRGVRAIDEIETIVESLPDDCGFRRRKSMYFASHRWHSRRLKREYECRKRHGFDVELLGREQLAERSSIQAPAAIFSNGDAQIDPYRFTQLLLRALEVMGARLYERVEVQEVCVTETGVRLSTSGGEVVAKRAIFATGYEAGRHLPKHVGRLHSTYAVASAPISDMTGWPEGCLVWETARPYFYARQTEDGRAIIGGEDTSFSTDHRREQLLERKVAKLVRRFETLFPALTFEPQYHWAGTFGETKDGLPYIGEPSAMPNCYFALGYGGNGITFSAIAAQLICDLFHGRPNVDAEVFSFDR